MSEYIFMNKLQFNKFIKSMRDIGLERKPGDKSAFPFDFKVIYKNKFILNFEYLHDALIFYIIGIIKKGKATYFKSKEIIKNENSTQLKIKKEIKKLMK